MAFIRLYCSKQPLYYYFFLIFIHFRTSETDLKTVSCLKTILSASFFLKNLRQFVSFWEFGKKFSTSRYQYDADSVPPSESIQICTTPTHSFGVCLVCRLLGCQRVSRCRQVGENECIIVSTTACIV